MNRQLCLLFHFIFWIFSSSLPSVSQHPECTDIANSLSTFSLNTLPERDGYIVIRVVFLRLCAWASVPCQSVSLWLQKRQQRKSFLRMRKFPFCWYLMVVETAGAVTLPLFSVHQRKAEEGNSWVQSLCNTKGSTVRNNSENPHKLVTVASYCAMSQQLHLLRWISRGFHGLRCPCAKAQRPLLDVLRTTLNCLFAFLDYIVLSLHWIWWKEQKCNAKNNVTCAGTVM